jgi:short-subunit dehydrogenase
MSTPRASKHAIVVGGSSGLGAAIGTELRARGFVVSNLARRAAPAGAADSSFACDVTHDAEVKRAITEATSAHGPSDLVVYSSGAPAMGHTLDVPIEAARACFDVNLWGFDHVVRAVLPGMMDRRQGVILLVSSIVALRAVPHEAYYAASKAAAARYAGCVAHEARRAGVRVKSLHVGLVETGFFERGGWWGMGVPTNAKGSGVTPADVAREALALVESGADERIVGWKEKIIALGDRVAPTLYDRLLRMRGS